MYDEYITFQLFKAIHTTDEVVDLTEDSSPPGHTVSLPMLLTIFPSDKGFIHFHLIFPPIEQRHPLLGS